MSSPPRSRITTGRVERETVPGRRRAAGKAVSATADDFKAVETWLREDVMPWDHNLRHLQTPCLSGIAVGEIEGSATGRIERLVRSTVRTHEAEIFEGTAIKLLPSTRRAMDVLIDSAIPSGDQDVEEVVLAQYHVQCPED